MNDIDSEMKKIPPHYRYTWCDAAICGCMGCVNKSASIQYGIRKISKEEWEDWVAKHPNPNPPVNTNMDVFLDYLNRRSNSK